MNKKMVFTRPKENFIPEALVSKVYRYITSGLNKHIDTFTIICIIYLVHAYLISLDCDTILSIFVVDEPSVSDILLPCNEFQKGIKCDLCEALIEELDSIAEKNSSVAKINETLYGICDKLEGAFKDLVDFTI